ncbi:MAG: nodulation protein NfeD, partial [Chlorobium sp.]|nr:nodulation protein NfeD [Chlorobium sp.]
MRRCPASNYVVIVVLFFAAMTVFSSALRAEERKGNKTVLFLSLQGTVNPGSADFFERAIDQAEKEKAHAILVELDTPGGLVSSLRAMV